MQSSYFVPDEKMANFMRNPGMNNQEGIFLYGITDPCVQRLLPPPLELADPKNPMYYFYAVDIREPSFAPWYMEGGIGVLAKYDGKVGVYFFSIMLSGPGALMGAFTGREGSGLPKKTCERMVVERTDEYAHCFIERKGVRLIDVELEIGQYNEPAYHIDAEGCERVEGGLLSEGGGCLLHKYRMGDAGICDMDLIFYDSPNRYYSWEPAKATVKLASSIDDPWAEIPLLHIYGAGWSVLDNWVKETYVLHSYPQDQAMRTFQHLFTGRYDRSLICAKHQRYEGR